MFGFRKPKTAPTQELEISTKVIVSAPGHDHSVTLKGIGLAFGDESVRYLHLVSRRNHSEDYQNVKEWLKEQDVYPDGVPDNLPMEDNNPQFFWVASNEKFVGDRNWVKVFGPSLSLLSGASAFITRILDQ